MTLVACAAAEEEPEVAATGEDALVGGCGPDRLIANAPPNKRPILERAAKWLREGTKYSQTTWKDGHRTDCSGYVSMAWGRSDFTTAQIPPRNPNSSIARVIEWDELEVGDAIARGDSYISDSPGHVMLYAGTDYAGFSCFWELTDPGDTRVSSVIKASLTGKYVAIRQR
ncbi:MAG: C40 family peptidase [Labilithrix sp.]|nr:C40 family peptidase [Labilithrix sp.]MCW5817370.1 C40 family peptidase [Labilithrix sp.]